MSEYLQTPLMDWLRERADGSLRGTKFRETIAEIERLRALEKQFDDGVKWAASVRDDNERLRGLLRDIATIAHDGGLHTASEWEVFVAIRRLTLAHWDKTGSEPERKVRVAVAFGASDATTAQPTTHAQHVAARDQMITDMFKTTRERCGLTTDQPTVTLPGELDLCDSHQGLPRPTYSHPAPMYVKRELACGCLYTGNDLNNFACPYHPATTDKSGRK